MTRAPAQLEAEGLAQPGTRFTYATGKLALWSADPAQVDPRGEVLRAADLAQPGLCRAQGGAVRPLRRWR